MLVFNKHLSSAYLIIAFLFFAGFVLRALKLYPGKQEPLLLDSSTAVIALVFAHTSGLFRFSNIRLLLIPISSLIIFPHLIYIISNKNIE